MDCCDVNGLRSTFRGPVVDQERRSFERRGLNRRQRELVAAAGPAEGSSLLDIGCGIAAPSLTLLGQGAERATLVDVSPDYLAAARRLVRARGLEDRIDIKQGDFVTLAAPESADIVLLDRVVCCYPDAAALLSKAASCSRRRLVLTYPRYAWWTRLLAGAANLGMKLFKRDYRLFLHSPDLIRRAAASGGLEPVATSAVGLWQLAVFEVESDE